MYRLFRIMIVTAGVAILAWVLKEVFGLSEEQKPEDLVQKIRMSGI